MCRSSFLFYIADPPGLNLEPIAALHKWRVNIDNIFKRLHKEFFKELDFYDSIEIMMELDLSKAVEFFTHEFFRIAHAFDGGNEMIPISDRYYPIRPITGETYLMYFLGMSWWLPQNEKEREEIIMKFLKSVRSKLSPQTENERLYELYQLSVGYEKLQDYRSILLDAMECRNAIRKH